MKQTASPASGRKHHWYFYPAAVLLVLVLLVAAFLLFLTVTEYRPQPVQPAETGAEQTLPALDKEQLRVLSFNTGYGSLGQESDFLMDGGTGTGSQPPEIVAKNMEGIEAVLTAADADIYLLQEVDKASARTDDVAQIQAYSEALPGYQWYYAPNFVCKFVPYPVQAPLGRIDSGVVTYCRYLLEDPQRVSLPVPFSWPVRTANLKRCMQVSRMPLEGSDQELILINFHLEAYDNGEGKLAQTRQLMELMQSEFDKGNYVIAGGDFNQTFPDVNTVIKPTTEWAPGKLDPLPEGWRYVYDDSTPSCRLLNQPYVPEDPMTQYYVLDGFIVSPNLQVDRVETLDEGFEFSDHNPVVMDVTLN